MVSSGHLSDAARAIRGAARKTPAPYRRTRWRSICCCASPVSLQLQRNFHAQLERSIRSSDIAGLGTDENVYLLLNQATEENLPLLTQRMAENGFQVTSVSLDGQHRLIAAAKNGSC